MLFDKENFKNIFNLNLEAFYHQCSIPLFLKLNQKQIDIECFQFLPYCACRYPCKSIIRLKDKIRVILAVRRVNSGTREDLAVDYAHTFLAAGTTKGENRACPYESVFTSRDGLIMQEARDDVYRIMLAEHLEPNTDLRIPDDHLAFVFEFMANLCQRFNESLEAHDLTEARRVFDVQQSFFEEHIYSWIDRFCDAVEGCCRTAFYKGLSQMTRGFVNADHEMLAEMNASIPA